MQDDLIYYERPKKFRAILEHDYWKQLDNLFKKEVDLITDNGSSLVYWHEGEVLGIKIK